MMKLSEAIRKGSKLRKQAYRSPNSDCDTTSCALIAALEAATGSIREAVHAYFKDQDFELFPILRLQVASPSNPNVKDDVWSIVVSLNDKSHWTREQIADWVATIEPIEATKKTSASTT